MEIYNRKKGLRLVARLALLFSLFEIASFDLSGQEIHGLYRDGKDQEIFSQLILTGNRFEFRVQDSYSQAYVGDGYFLTSGDTLILVYEPDASVIESSFKEYLEDDCDVDSSSVVDFSFKVKDNWGGSLPNVGVFFMGVDGPFKSGPTDNEGELSISVNRDLIKDIRIRQSGYNMLTILPQNLTNKSCMGYDVTLTQLPSRFHKSQITIEKILIITKNDKVVGFQEQNSSRRWMRVGK